MSQLLPQAEAQLNACVAQMNLILHAIDDALPQSSLGNVETASADVPDTLCQRQEWEEEEERRRLTGPVEALKHSMSALRGAIALLGGGVDAEGNVIDVPLNVLDRDIEILSAHNARAGEALLTRYAEAEAVAGSIEKEVMNTPLPAIV